MDVVRVLATAALLAAVGCSSPADPDPAEGSDPQDPPRVTTPEHPGPDGERTRVVPRRDELPDDVLASRLERAQVAFVGEVVEVAHRDVTLPEMGAVPHTFVTYRVDDPVKGGVAGEQVTLRFVGGVSDDGTKTLEVSQIPTFVRGDVDLVFVTDDNGRTACPLVDCESGRLPVVDDAVTSPTGHLLVVLEDGRTRFAEATTAADPTEDPAPEVARRPIVGDPLSRSALVRRLERPGPAAASLSVSPLHPSR